MPAIKYNVPYELAINANDVGSGKRLSNIFYYRNGPATGPAPAYGADIAGSALGTLLTALNAAWIATVVTIMNANYKLLNFTMRSILGKEYKTPYHVISALTTGSPVIIDTAGPHGLVTGDSIFITGVTSPPGVNGTWRVTVIDDSELSLDGSAETLTWSSNGKFQKATGGFQFRYGDKEVQTASTAGSIVDDALPLFSAASVRRHNTGVGKSWRSRVSLSPMSEEDSLDGGLVPTSVARINTQILAFDQGGFGITNGGTDVGAGLSFNYSVSKKIATALPPIFTESDSWTRRVTGWGVQPNLGSMVRRKPRLTSIIA